MKRKSILVAAALAASLAVAAQGAFAQRGGGGGMHGGGGMQGMHGGGGMQGSWQGSDGGHGGNWHGSGGNWHGGSWHGGWHGYWGPSFGVYLGAPWYWNYPYYGYPYYGYPYYGGSTIIYDDPAPSAWGAPSGSWSAPPDNVAPEPPPSSRPPAQFRYYCPNSGYYPDVRTCPKGWVQQPQT